MHPSVGLAGRIVAAAFVTQLPCYVHAVERAVSDTTVSIRGDYRARYEALDPQYRSGFSGRDQALSLRGRLRVDMPLQRGRLTAEIMDARATLNDEESPVFTSTVNTLELIQAAATWELAPALLDGAQTLTVGLLTKDLGSRRLVARNRFRNTVNTFAGVDWTWSDANGRTVNAFYLSPLRRLPEDRGGLLDDAHEVDALGRDTLLAGVHVEWPATHRAARGQLLMVRSSGPETRIPVDAWSALTTIGLRFFREPATAAWDYDIEAALQRGRSRSEPDAAIQRHDAYFAHVSAGFTFARLPRLRLAAQYDYASGDNDPLDNEANRFDPLYGARRFDFGPTGIYGPFLRSNLEAAGVRATVWPTPSVALAVAYQGFRLASATDAWVLAGLRDTSGRSGKLLGHQLESTLTWDIIPRRLSLETGIAHLRYGAFPRNAPNAGGRRRATYAYTQLLATFGSES